VENYKKIQLEIEQIIAQKKYSAHPKELYQPIEYIMALGGKRLRPLLVLAACDLFEKNTKPAIPAALAVELFHNFTLIHDDLMDKAPLRRNQQTVHIKWNNNIAILSGDAMMVCAYEELCKSPSEKLSELLSVFNKTALQVCEGQQLDMNFELLPKVSVMQYLQMIELKTAVLLGASLKMGAILADANQHEAELLYQFGKNIGIAFQLQDDILDVYANTEKFGKQIGGDIIANKKTYLLLKALEIAESNRYLKEELHQWINAPHFDSSEKVKAVTDIFNFLNVKALAENEMKKHFSIALTNISDVNANIDKKKQLVQFAESLMVREV
jgi:geranylgeranyl diphosphate synthase, type II